MFNPMTKNEKKAIVLDGLARELFFERFEKEFKQCVKDARKMMKGLTPDEISTMLRRKFWTFANYPFVDQMTFKQLIESGKAKEPWHHWEQRLKEVSWKKKDGKLIPFPKKGAA